MTAHRLPAAEKRDLELWLAERPALRRVLWAETLETDSNETRREMMLLAAKREKARQERQQR
jgi:hypothetical protein